MFKMFAPTVVLAVGLLVVACDASSNAVTECGTGTCSAGEHCVDAAANKCEEGCDGDQNCNDGETCVDSACVAGSTGGGAPGQLNCCVNDVYYKCPDQSAFEECAGFDLAACDFNCAPGDFACHQQCQMQAISGMPDPSSCEEQPGACPVVSQGCNNPSFGDCVVDGDCDSGEHCTDGKCYDNDAGSKCVVDGDCGDDNHCTDGCCSTNEVGSDCVVDDDCGSNNHCTNGTCYANKLGSPCIVDGDCGPGNSCVDGTCE